MSPDPTRLPDLVENARGELVELALPSLVTTTPTPVATSAGRATVAEHAAVTGQSEEIVAIVWAVQDAARLAHAVRAAGSLAWAVGVGSEVEVVGGRRVPHGYYRVLRHHTVGGVIKITVVDPFSKLKHPYEHVLIVGSADVRVLPNWPAAFRGWGDWQPLLAGACRRGLSQTDWLVIADWIEDEPGRVESCEVLKASVASGVPLEYVLTELRRSVAPSPTYQGQPPASAAAHHLSMNPGATWFD